MFYLFTIGPFAVVLTLAILVDRRNRKHTSVKDSVAKEYGRHDEALHEVSAHSRSDNWTP